MRSKLKVLVAAAAATLVVPQFAMAGDVEDQLRQMNERMAQLEDQLQATQDQLDTSNEQVQRQAGVIEKAGLDRESESGLSAFYNMVEIHGWLAASWFWNFNNPEGNTLAFQNYEHSVNSGESGLVIPFHPDHNSFSVDQLWFEIEKPVTEESRAGFRADMAYGKTASFLSHGINRLCGNNVEVEEDSDEELQGGGIAGESDGGDDDGRCMGDSANDFALYQAYVQYLTPWGPTVKAGKMGTWIGAEVAPTIYNYNITRGIVYSALQPITHYGLTIDHETEGGFVWGVGVINSIMSVDPDFNNAKNVMGKVGFAGESFSAIGSIVYGPEEKGEGCQFNNDGGCEQGIVSFVTTWDPTENFSAWTDFTYAWAANTNDPNGPGVAGGQEAWGIAAAGRYAFTQRLGFALRGEYARDYDGYFGVQSSATDARIWGLTGTLDFEVTENLIAKWEARYDNVDWDDPTDIDTDEFVSSGRNEQFPDTDQWLTGIELTYKF